MRTAIAFILVAAGGLVEAQADWIQETVKFSPGFSIEAASVPLPWLEVYQSPPQSLTAWAQCYGVSWTMKMWDPYVVQYFATSAVGCGLEPHAYVIPNVNWPPGFPLTINTNWDILLLANSSYYKFWELRHADPAANPYQQTAVSAKWFYGTTVGTSTTPGTTFWQNTKASADYATVADVTHWQPMFSPMDGVYYYKTYPLPAPPYCNFLHIASVNSDYSVKLVKNTPTLAPSLPDSYKVFFWLNLVADDGTVTDQWIWITKFAVLFSGGAKTWDSDRLADNHIYYFSSAYNCTQVTCANIYTDEFLTCPPW
jgi:hypothetical protein